MKKKKKKRKKKNRNKNLFLNNMKQMVLTMVDKFSLEIKAADHKISKSIP